MTEPSPKNFCVAIVGGGVCGLACAIALQKSGISTDVFEAAAAFGEVGAGIGLGPNALEALKGLGLLDAVLAKVNPNDLASKGFLFYAGLGDHELVYDYPPAPEDASLSMHRAVFLDSLVGLVDPRTTHFNKRCTSITESPTKPGRLIVHFFDGSSHEADVVLGADGIRSAVRAFVVNGGGVETGNQNPGPASAGKGALAYSNTAAYRGLIPYAALKAAGFKTPLADRPACFVGPNKHIIVVPIKNGELINVAAFSAKYDVPIGSQNIPEGRLWVDEIFREEIQKEFEGWGADVATLLRLMPEKIIRWSVHVVDPPLDSYARKHVALLGDAAHGMLPHLGAGAGQGLEDALLLARLLSHPETSLDNIKAVLEAYSHIRQPRSQMVWEASRRAGSIYDHHGPHGPTGLNEDLRDLWRPIWRYNVAEDVQSAVTLLRKEATYSTSGSL